MQHPRHGGHILAPATPSSTDYFDPRNLKSSLRPRAIGGLFFAGQINGHHRLCEAAAQGLLAGRQRGAAGAGREPWCPRDEAHLGVLVDDLITCGSPSPTACSTLRAEYRLSLREDNADLRLTEKGRELGLVDDQRWAVFCRKREAIERETTAPQGGLPPVPRRRPRRRTEQGGGQGARARIPVLRAAASAADPLCHES